MDNELMRYATGEVKPQRIDRVAAARAKKIYDEVREKDLMARGAFALAADIMDAATYLDAKQRSLAGADNPELDMLLGAIKMDVMRQALKIQNSLYDPWGF